MWSRGLQTHWQQHWTTASGGTPTVRSMTVWCIRHTQIRFPHLIVWYYTTSRSYGTHTHTLSCPSCSMMTLAPGMVVGSVMLPSIRVWPLSHTLFHRWSRETRYQGVPATHWCLLMSLSDRQSWLVWCIWETAVAPVTCQADLSSARDSSCVRGMFARFRRSLV